MHLVLVKSGAPLTPLQLFCKQCVDMREAKRRTRKTGRESVILESLDRKIQRQESLREDAQEGFKMEELPAEMGERRGLISTDRSAGAISLGVSTSSLDKLADVIPKQLGVKERDFDAVEGYNLDSNRHGDRHFPAGTQEKGMDGRERLPLTSGRKPKGVSKLHFAALHRSRSEHQIANLESGVERHSLVADSSKSKQHERSLSKTSLEPMTLGSSSSATSSRRLPSASLRTLEAYRSPPQSNRGSVGSLKSSSQVNTPPEVVTGKNILPSPPKRQRQSSHNPSRFRVNLKDELSPPSAPISLGNKQTPGPNPKSSAPSSSSSPSTSPTTRGLSGLYFAPNLGAESKVNRDLGFKTPSPPSSSPVREPRSRRHRAIIRARAAVLSLRTTPHAPFTRSPLRRSFPVAAPESTATQIPTSEPGDRGSATPFRSPGNREGKVNSTPKRKRSEPLLHYQQYAGGEESEEEMFIPDVAKLAESYERMKQYEGQAFGSFGSPTRRRELPKGGVVRSMSELDALFEEDGDRVVEVDSDLAWKIERYDE
ncbi:uncharacterized protein PODANS_1_13450 [Podospora anserina S mat+]|uniref:Podospora anserina S mat+ genomic DNA chromosome 1, supercontig 3 n=1 Tax=Podospora anserina (strain S / ATCC MYA-4624 / DSM 980 / FGSC 10383) TaxID=515849 RepID=B2AM06_PODAN|nr:uncharacterized protein PODANS_1_13450 [Podospora anserina S mat+]CAP64954.1 unnamed protein product [Podospora anserina S mat+]CDP23732.1 Putative protein of unknown function [Podospora anserina S mat+]